MDPWDIAFTVPQTAGANKTPPRRRLCDRLWRLHSSATGAAEPDADASYVAAALPQTQGSYSGRSSPSL